MASKALKNAGEVLADFGGLCGVNAKVLVTMKTFGLNASYSKCLGMSAECKSVCGAGI